MFTEILHQHQKAQKNRFPEAETLLNSLGLGEKLSLRHQVQDLSLHEFKQTVKKLRRLKTSKSST